MPELPEVEFGRTVAEAAALGKRITALRCARDAIVFERVGPRAFHAALVGAKVEAVRRHGKHIWFELDRRPWPLYHFGMTGAFRVPEGEPLRLASSPKVVRAEWPPRFTKIQLGFDDGGELVMTNARRLGRIRLRRDPEMESPIAELGFDPLTGLPRLSTFRSMLRGRTTRLKVLLLDQRFAAGVGNWIADEVLFQAGLDPRRRVSSLTENEERALHRALANVIRTAVRVGADKQRFPREWLFHVRWGRDPNARILSGDRVEHLTVAGRSTAWVPARQR